MSGKRKVATNERQQINFEKNNQTHYFNILLNLIHISILQFVLELYTVLPVFSVIFRVLLKGLYLLIFISIVVCYNDNGNSP